MEPKILFEDDFVLVIDKPTGLVVNRAESVKGETVQDWVERHVILVSEAHPESKRDAGQASMTREDFVNRNGIVHRIDKETSGVLLIAKTPEAFVELQRQFKEREVEKSYTALLHGKLEPEEGIIKEPVGRLPWNRERFGVLEGGREAETRYKLISNYSSNEMRSKKSNSSQKASNDIYSLVEFYPKTGRTHQIRVHAKHLGHPLVSDTFYTGRKTSRNDRKWCPRLFLHATEITFTHPKSKERIKVKSELPKDLEEVLGSLSSLS